MTYATWQLTKLNMDTPYMTIMGIYVLRSFGMAFHNVNGNCSY